ncbi:unnamed protein product [Rangifer tarandus platyrhynchus]|uniref:Uncharacterized protein n=2 Tax=Rangifer tarandus platyrhynchus TaxID=3082113 RepID=A0ABN8YIR8_RANTA|nr:unnamed protein product [Rangifer tarandus platyrhynchus]
MAALPFGRLSTTLLCAMVVQASSTSILFAELLPPSRPFRCLLTANRSPLPGSALQAPHLRTQPLCAMVDTLSGLGEQGWAQDRLPRSHSVLPASDWCCLLFPSEKEAPFRPGELPSRVAGPAPLPLLTLFLLVSLVLPGYEGIFLVLSGVKVPC